MPWTSVVSAVVMVYPRGNAIARGGVSPKTSAIAKEILWMCAVCVVVVELREVPAIAKGMVWPRANAIARVTSTTSVECVRVPVCPPTFVIAMKTFLFRMEKMPITVKD